VIFAVRSFHFFLVLFGIVNSVPSYLGIFQEHQAPHFLIGFFAGGTSRRYAGKHHQRQHEFDKWFHALKNLIHKQSLESTVLLNVL
jgi:hypothetical protein